MKRMIAATVLLVSMILLMLSGCDRASVVTAAAPPEPVLTSNETSGSRSYETETTTAQTETTTEAATETEAVKTMILMIGSTEVPVVWEDNASVEELRKLAENGLSIQMSKYGGFEQVGPIGQRISDSDKKITTSPGDIVLYSGNQMVSFYGSNTWSYTNLGKINLSKKELKDLLSKGDVKISIAVR